MKCNTPFFLGLVSCFYSEENLYFKRIFVDKDFEKVPRNTGVSYICNKETTMGHEFGRLKDTNTHHTHTLTQDQITE